MPILLVKCSRGGFTSAWKCFESWNLLLKVVLLSQESPLCPSEDIGFAVSSLGQGRLVHPAGQQQRPKRLGSWTRGYHVSVQWVCPMVAASRVCPRRVRNYLGSLNCQDHSWGGPSPTLHGPVGSPLLDAGTHVFHFTDLFLGLSLSFRCGGTACGSCLPGATIPSNTFRHPKESRGGFCILLFRFCSFFFLKSSLELSSLPWICCLPWPFGCWFLTLWCTLYCALPLIAILGATGPAWPLVAPSWPPCG